MRKTCWEVAVELSLGGRAGASPSSRNGEGHSWQSMQPGSRSRIVEEPRALGELQAVLAARLGYWEWGASARPSITAPSSMSPASLNWLLAVAWHHSLCPLCAPPPFISHFSAENRAAALHDTRSNREDEGPARSAPTPL